LKGATRLEGQHGSLARGRSGAPILVLLSAVVIALVGGCGSAAPGGSATPPADATATPLPPVSAAVAQTRLQVANLLSAQGYQLVVPTQPFRPPESPRLASAARAVFQVALPSDSTHGQIVIYEFANTDQANQAGAEMAGYIGSGPGSVQFPPDSQHVLRQLGTTLVFFSWSPENSPGQDGARILAILGILGIGFAIPR
jgi:hypothetical protein